ncbi:MAG: CotH kinase family protein [Bacteroidia bacterium]
MMKRFLFACLISVCFSAGSQTYNGNTGPIQNNGVETYFTCSVSGLSPAVIDSTFGFEQLCLTISHPAVQELYIYLISPSGRTVEISEGASCSGQNYTGTCFNSSAAMPITSTVAPYTGTFRPIGYLGRFNDGQTALGTWTLVVKDYLAFVNSGSLVSWSMQFGNSPPKPVILAATTLPIVIINTNNQIITDVKKTVDFAVIYNGVGQINHPGDPKNNYNGKAQIHIRGNTTQNFEKKPYSVELHDASGAKLSAPLLGMPTESDWELIAEYQDKTLMRIPMTYQLSRQMGNYAARTRNVEVIFNGEYAGVYALVEKIKIDIGRLNIRKLSTSDNAMPFVSGSYILKIDRHDVPGWFSLLSGDSPSGSHFFYQYDEPKDSVITSQQRSYIQSTMNDFENMMNSPNYADPVNGYPKLVDVPSCVDVFIVNEMSKNVDGYRLSSYLYKQDVASGGKIHLGPVWDYDIAWDNCNYANTFDPTGWEYQVQDTVYPSPVWWKKFMQDTNFVNAVSCRWNYLRQSVLKTSAIYNYIDSVSTALGSAQQRNFRQWPILGTYIFPNPQNQAGATFSGEVASLKSWISSRFTWLDNVLQNKNCVLGINALQQNSFNVQVYPNPMENKATVKVDLGAEAELSFSLTDAFGRQIKHISLGRRPAGPSEIALSKEDLASGLYLYQVQVNDAVHNGKLLVE